MCGQYQVWQKQLCVPPPGLDRFCLFLSSSVSALASVGSMAALRCTLSRCKMHTAARSEGAAGQVPGLRLGPHANHSTHWRWLSQNRAPKWSGQVLQDAHSSTRHLGCSRAGPVQTVGACPALLMKLQSQKASSRNKQRAAEQARRLCAAWNTAQLEGLLSCSSGRLTGLLSATSRGFRRIWAGVLAVAVACGHRTECPSMSCHPGAPIGKHTAGSITRDHV